MVLSASELTNILEMTPYEHIENSEQLEFLTTHRNYQDMFS